MARHAVTTAFTLLSMAGIAAFIAMVVIFIL